MFSGKSYQGRMLNINPFCATNVVPLMQIGRCENIKCWRRIMMHSEGASYSDIRRDASNASPGKRYG